LAGQLVIGGSGQMGAGTNAAAITDNGILNYNSSAAQTLSGSSPGAASLILNNGSLTLPPPIPSPAAPSFPMASAAPHCI